jgi:predicted P-loop ATPase
MSAADDFDAMLDRFSTPSVREPTPEPLPEPSGRAELARELAALVDPDGEIAPAGTPDAPPPRQIVLQVEGKKPVSNVANATAVLAAIYKDRLFYDEFHRRVFFVDTHGNSREWKDVDVINTQLILQRQHKLTSISRTSVQDAALAIAHMQKRDCVADWLNSLQWDGLKRLTLVFPHGWGTSTNRYYIRAGRNFILGMVARALKPGCQVDTMPVFEGPQGIYKTSALKVLAGDWYGTVNAAFDEKDFMSGVNGIWLSEIAELAAMRNAQVEKVKDMLTTTVYRYRKAYAANEESFPRRGVFAGTTNSEEYLRDTTGNRRFIPVKCGRIDLRYIRANRDQLFAEAVHLIKAGRQWWRMPRKITEAVQAARVAANPYVVRVAGFLADLDKRGQRQTDMDDICVALGVSRDQRAEQIAVGVAIRQIGGWLRRRKRVGQALSWVYVRET